MIYQSECKNRNPSNIPILGAYDFETAFPSVIHAWIWLVLMVRKVPAHYIKLFQGIYHNASAVYFHSNQKFVIIKFLSGVLQGCPGSAFLFNNALDPFLILFHNTLREMSRGIIRACADDLGVALSRLRYLELLHPIFVSANEFAGLTLKPPKCILVPLCRFSEKVSKDITKWLKRNIPHWANFEVLDTTKLLGFYIGPGAGRKNWAEQISKCKTRIQNIQSAKASVKLNVHTYNTRVVPVFSYVSQLLNAPSNLETTERAVLHTVFRLPQNALCHQDFFHLQQLGGPSPRSISASCASALFRTACKTVTNWPEWIQQLTTAATELLPLYPLALGELSAEHWDSPPIACNLKEASLGFPSSAKWSVGASNAIHAIRKSKSERIKMQKVCYDNLMQARFSNNIHETIERRLNDLFSPHVVDCVNHISLERCLVTLKESKVSVAIKVLKCWINGWATSYRYHEDKLLPCLLGCHNCKDNLEHYLVCPHLFALVSYLIEGVSDIPLIRWGLEYPSKINHAVVSCVFSGYHAIRTDLRDNPVFIEHNLRNLPSPVLRRAWSVFAQSFKVEARELGVQCHQFSLPDFLIFIS